MKVHITKRKARVDVQEHDVFNLDETLACIIVPALKLYKKRKKGIPGSVINDEFEKIVTSDQYWEEHSKGVLHRKVKLLEKQAKKQFNDQLDKMIWSFSEISSRRAFKRKSKNVDNNGLTYNQYRAKLQEGIDLFSKHFTDLWT